MRFLLYLQALWSTHLHKHHWKAHTKLKIQHCQTYFVRFTLIITITINSKIIYYDKWWKKEDISFCSTIIWERKIFSSTTENLPEDIFSDSEVHELSIRGQRARKDKIRRNLLKCDFFIQQMIIKRWTRMKFAKPLHRMNYYNLSWSSCDGWCAVGQPSHSFETKFGFLPT